LASKLFATTDVGSPHDTASIVTSNVTIICKCVQTDVLRKRCPSCLTWSPTLSCRSAHLSCHSKTATTESVLWPHSESGSRDCTPCRSTSVTQSCPNL